MPDRAGLEADYVIIGAGATAMAFADTLLSESDLTAIMVDRRHRPGGHWNDAYPYVRLHGPSAVYGVNSRQLGSDRIDPSGLNEGLFELATGSEICTYFDEVIRHQLLPTGRLHYLPMHNYTEQGEAVSLISGKATRLKARKKIVDATAADTQIPSRTPPAFEVGDGVTLIPPNDLTRLSGKQSRLIVLGAGKTAIDAVTWLLTNGADPDRITWVRPRDAWIINRATIQPDYRFFNESFGALAAGLEAALTATSADEIFLKLEEAGAMRRIDPSVLPTMYHCAIVSDRELALTRQVRDVVRLGRVRAIETDRMIFERGEVKVEPDTVFVNCTARGVPRKPAQPVFQPGRIVPQFVRTCSPTFSGALIAKLEIMMPDDAEKNALTRPVTIPDTPFDWLGMTLAGAANASAWRRHGWLMEWLVKARLDRFMLMIQQAQMRNDTAALQTLGRYMAVAKPGAEKIAQLMAAGA